MNHFLIVHEFDPTSDDWYDVEDNCPETQRHAFKCAVEYYVSEEGISSYWHHADDPDVFADYTQPLKPGRYAIEAWETRHPAGPWGLEEWDGGLRLVEGQS